MRRSAPNPDPVRLTTSRALVIAAWILVAAVVPAAAEAAAPPVPPTDPAGSATTRADTTAAPLRLQLTEAAGPVRIDGRLDENAWRVAPVATGFVQQAPDDGAPASQATAVRVVREGDALIIGARMEDDDPSEIMARLARRDHTVLSDWFVLYLDSYHDRRTAFAFFVNAAGVQADARVTEETRSDDGWDAVWESAVSIDDGGWSVEMRIPLSQIRFEPGAVDAWGINFRRVIGRRNENAYWAPVEQGSDRLVSLFGTLRGVQGLEAGRRLEVVPYAAAGVTRDPFVSADDPFQSATEPRMSMGADIRAGIGRGLTLTATINPDFGQIEADPAVVNLSAFEIYQSERRPFFVEGSEVFELSYPLAPPLFYSRRIGRAPQARAPGDAVYTDAPVATTILGAAKVTGRSGPWTLGVLQAVTDDERARYTTEDGLHGDAAVEPLTSQSVARLARQFRQGRSGLGVLGTALIRDRSADRLGFLHSHAYSAGVDGWHRFGDGDWLLRGALIGSHVRGDSSAILRTQRSPGHYFHRPGADYLTLDSSRTALSGYRATLGLNRVTGSWRGGIYTEAASPGLEVSDLGFNPTLDRVMTNAWVDYNDFTPGQILRQWDVRGSLGYQSTFGGERLEFTQTLNTSFQLLNYWGGRIFLMRHAPGWDPTELRGGPALRKPGRWMGSLSANTDSRKAVYGRSHVFWEVEDGTGGNQLRSSADLHVRASDQLNFSAGLDYTVATDAWRYLGRVDLGAGYLVGGLDRRIAALSGRLDYTVSPDLSLQLYARPYLSAGRYQAFRTVADPDARAFDDRFHTFADDAVSIRAEDDGRRTVDLDADTDGTSDLSFTAPDYNVRSFQLNAVARWEYRPGSTIFLVWSHDRDSRGRGPADLGPDLGALRGAQGRHTLMIKATYWLGM